jgi:hypothetical protein
VPGVGDRVVWRLRPGHAHTGIDKNVEAGILVRGGTAPMGVVEHFTELTATGALIRL